MSVAKHSSKGVVPTGTVACTIGVDVQSDGFVWVLCCWGRRMECWLPLTDRISGGDLRTTEPWQALIEILEIVWLDFEGNAYRPVMNCIDVQGTAYGNTLEFCRAHGGRLRLKAIRGYAPARGLAAGKSFGIIRNTYLDRSSHVAVTNIDTTIAKNVVAEMLSRKVPGPGFIHLPCGVNGENVGGWDQETISELTAEFRRRKNLRGYTISVWEKHPGRPNHRLDCLVYGLAALALSRLKIDECDLQRTEVRNIGKNEQAHSPSPFGARRMLGTRELAIDNAGTGGIVPHWSKGSGGFGKLAGSGFNF